jgi:hypothetical protein
MLPSKSWEEARGDDWGKRYFSVSNRLVRPDLISRPLEVSTQFHGAKGLPRRRTASRTVVFPELLGPTMTFMVRRPSSRRPCRRLDVPISMEDRQGIQRSKLFHPSASKAGGATRSRPGWRRRRGRGLPGVLAGGRVWRGSRPCRRRGRRPRRWRGRGL